MWYVGSLIKLSGFLFFLTFIVACGNSDRDLSSLPDPYGVVADIGIAEYPAVVKVISPGGSGLCTGTFVSERAVLTAAHCTDQAGTYTVLSSFGTFSTSHKVNLGPGVLNDPNDLSLLVFTSDVASREEGQIFDFGDSIASGDEIRLVGFGCNNISTRRGAGVKRTGTNIVYYLNDYINLVSPATTTSSVRGILGAQNRAGSCFGDSGGPALRKVNGEWKVVGVAHAGGEDGQWVYSEYVNVANRTDNRSNLYDADEFYNLGIRGL